MATYPTLITKYSKHREPIIKAVIDRSEDGVARVRELASQKYRHTFQHPMISTADKEALEVFYNANRRLPFTYVSLLDSVSNECVFAEFEPVWQPGNRWNVNVKIEQV